MAGKINKFLAFTAAAGAVAAGVYYYLQNKNANQYDDFEDDVDFDDFSDDADISVTENESQRSYVDLNPEPEKSETSESSVAQADDVEVTSADSEETDTEKPAPVSAAEDASNTEASEKPNLEKLSSDVVSFAQNSVSETAKAAKEAAETKVEEFFDDEDDLDTF